MTENFQGDGRLLARIDERTENIEKAIAEIKNMLVGHETRLRILEQEQTAQAERMKIWQAAQATLTMIASSVAAWLGVQK